MHKYLLLDRLTRDADARDGTMSSHKLKEGIQYAEYDIEMIDGKTKTVYVPSRRTDIFEDEMMKNDILTENIVRSILRKCNGVTSI